MPTYFANIIDGNSCIGDTLSTLNIDLTSLDSNLSALSSYTVNTINSLSALLKSEVNFLSTTINNLSSLVSTEINFLSSSITNIASNTANWNTSYNSYVFNSKVTTVTTNPYVLSNSGIVLFNCASNIITAQIPTASANNGIQYTIKKIDSSTNNLVLSTFQSNTLDGTFTRTLSTQYTFLTFVSNGVNWYII